MYKIWFDGYSSPKTHDRAGYCVIVEKDGITSAIEHGTFSPDTTCNLAEIGALTKALEFAKLHLPPHEYKIIIGDSKLAVGLFNGTMRTKFPHLRDAVIQAQIVSPANFEVRWSSRKYNKAGIFLEKRHNEN